MNRWGWVALAFLLGVAGYWRLRFETANADARRLSLKYDSLEAASDTQRVVFLRDLAVIERRVVQAELQRDSIDRLLKLKPKASTTTTVVVPRVDTVLVGTPTDTAGRVATFATRQPPYTVVAEVALPTPPDQPSMRLGIQLDTIPLNLRLGCRPGKPFATAHAAVTAPIWAQVQLQALTQDPALCNPPRIRYGFRVPGIGIKLPWWAPVVGGAVLWEVVR